MYDLVGNPKDRFSRVAAQITLKQKQGKTISCMYSYKVGQRMPKFMEIKMHHSTSIIQENVVSIAENTPIKSSMLLK